VSQTDVLMIASVRQVTRRVGRTQVHNTTLPLGSDILLRHGRNEIDVVDDDTSAPTPPASTATPAPEPAAGRSMIYDTPPLVLAV
jgi:hypothetical protein